MVKDEVKRMFGDDLEENPDKRAKTDSRSAFLKCWTSKSWKKVQAEKQAQITSVFQRCGMLNAVDGSEDALIEVEGYDTPYSLEDGEDERKNESESSVGSWSNDPESNNSSDEAGDMKDEWKPF